MRILSEQIDLMLEVSLASNGDRENLLFLVERLAPLRPRDVKSVFLAMPIRTALNRLKDSFEEYMADQAKTPLGARADAEAVATIRRVYDILKATIEELRTNGTRRLDRIYEPEPEEEAGPEGESEPEEDPEPEEEAGPEEQAVTTAEKEEVADYLDEAAELLAVQAVNSGRPSQLIPKFGRILKNFFITKRVLRKGALTEELRSLDEEEASPEPSNAAKIDPSGTKDDELIKVLTKEIEVAPEQARKAFEELQGELKVKKIDDAFEEEIKKREAKGIKYLILRAAGVGIVGAAGALKEGKLAPMVLDLDVLKRRSLDEGLLGMFGAWIEYFMRGIFGGWAPNIQVKGSKSDVESFARAINGEAKYMDAVRRYGLDHPTTYKNKAKLDNSVKNFERDTGIKWPFK